MSGFALVLDGQRAGLLRGAAGGAVSADVIPDPDASGPFQQKHLGPSRVEDLFVRVGMGMAPAFYGWVGAAWKGQGQRKSGSVIGFDDRFQARSELEFFDAAVSEVTLPLLDAASHEPAEMAVGLSPERVRTVEPRGRVTPGAREKPWTRANFRVSIDGIDTTRVTRVDPLRITLPVGGAAVGQSIVGGVRPINFPDLSITVSAVAAESWIAWHDDFVVKGNNAREQERRGSIVLLSTDGQDQLARIELFQVGIFRLARTMQTPPPPTLAADLYCERMELIHAD